MTPLHHICDNKHATRDEVETVYELWKEAAEATDDVRGALLPSSNRRFCDA